MVVCKMSRTYLLRPLCRASTIRASVLNERVPLGMCLPSDCSLPCTQLRQSARQLGIEGNILLGRGRRAAPIGMLVDCSVELRSFAAIGTRERKQCQSDDSWSYSAALDLYLSR